ncbi:MAG: hypothetical protein WCK67_05320 [bacterium]
MGLAASQARFLNLTARKTDLEFQGQSINQQRMNVSQQAQTLLNYTSLLDTSSAQYQQNLVKIDSIHQIDRRLEIELNSVDTQQQAVQTEIEAVKKVIDKNIDLVFKTFA